MEPSDLGYLVGDQGTWLTRSPLGHVLEDVEAKRGVALLGRGVRVPVDFPQAQTLNTDPRLFMYLSVDGPLRRLPRFDTTARCHPLTGPAVLPMLTDEEHSMAVVFHAGGDPLDDPLRDTDPQPIIRQLGHRTFPKDLSGREGLRIA
jgi:hypothetical protein